jgi:hypothetical protein
MSIESLHATLRYINRLIARGNIFRPGIGRGVTNIHTLFDTEGAP